MLRDPLTLNKGGFLTIIPDHTFRPASRRETQGALIPLYPLKGDYWTSMNYGIVGSKHNNQYKNLLPKERARGFLIWGGSELVELDQRSTPASKERHTADALNLIELKSLLQHRFKLGEGIGLVGKNLALIVNTHQTPRRSAMKWFASA